MPLSRFSLAYAGKIHKGTLPSTRTARRVTHAYVEDKYGDAKLGS